MDIRTRGPIPPATTGCIRFPHSQASIPWAIIGSEFQSRASAHSSLNAQVRGSGCKPALCWAVRGKKGFFLSSVKSQLLRKSLKIAGKSVFKKFLMSFQTHYRNTDISHFYFDMCWEAYGQEALWLFYTLYSHHFISASSFQLQHTCM